MTDHTDDEVRKKYGIDHDEVVEAARKLLDETDADAEEGGEA